MRRMFLAAALLVSVALPATANDPTVAVELNKLEPHGDACRAYLVVRNGAGTPFRSLKLDLVMFDPDGIVARRLAVETAPLATDKTILKVFDIAGLACPGIGRILMNDVLACDAADGPRDDCLALVTPSARGDVAFIK